MSVYEDEIELVRKLIEKEEIPTGNPKGLATLMVITANYGAGDALAGMYLKNIIDSQREQLNGLAKRVFGKEWNGYVSTVTMLDIIETLGEKHEVFKALNYMALTGRTDMLWKLAEEWGIKE